MVLRVKNMKKLAALMSILMVSACNIHAGDVSVWDARKEWVEEWNSYPIVFFNQEPLLLKTEYITEKSHKVNVMLTAYTGYSMVDTKVFRKDYFIADKVHAAMDGGLVGASAPVMFKTDEESPIIGQVTVDNEDYVLVPTDLDGFVILVARDGSLYPSLGQIRYNRLTLLDDSYLPSPDNFHFRPVTATSVEESKPVKGFDLRYDGIKSGKMFFTYLDFSQADGKSGEFEVITFPRKPGNYRINNIVIRVLNASPEKIDYMILNG